MTLTRRPAIDLMVEKLAQTLLAWTARRQSNRRSIAAGSKAAQPTHERMALIRENEQLRAWAGSPFGR